MRARLWVVGVVVLAGVALAGCSGGGKAPAATATAPGTGLLRGVVVDEAIRPVPGVHLELDGIASNATTGADGAFAFADLEPGAHLVRASKVGFADAVGQVDLHAGDNPALKLVLVADVSSIPYAETFKIDGFVQCGSDTAGEYFAACGSGNVGSFIVCAQAGVCQGNVSDDRYIVIQRFDKTPTFLVIEVAWTPTQDLGRELSVWLGSATKEQLKFYPETPDVWNITEGESPLYGTMDSKMLQDSHIGVDAWFLAQVFAGPSQSPCPPPADCGTGMVAQQPFQMFFTAFYGYVPPSDWRFATTGQAPPPPTP